MTFHDWIYSNYPDFGVAINKQWGLLHILTLLVCILVPTVLGLTLRKKDVKTRQNVILGFAGAILLFELSRRVINLSREGEYTLNRILGTLLPRPWCAISCWMIMITAVAKKRFLYNFTAATAFLNALIFFAYPSVGFDGRYIVFENVYSICTHALLLLSALSMLTLGLTDYKYKNPTFKDGALKELLCLAFTFAYAFIEIYLLKIEADPLYFLPGNEAMEILGLPYPAYLAVYIVFLTVYFNLYYLVPILWAKWKAKKAETKNA